MGKKIEILLNTVADMQKCISADDALTEMINAESDELFESDHPRRNGQREGGHPQ